MSKSPNTEFPVPIAIMGRLEKMLLKLIPVGVKPERHIISLRVTDSDGTAFPGSIVGPPCIRCGTRVWLAPSTQDLVRGKTTIAICIDCFTTMAEKAEGETDDETVRA